MAAIEAAYDKILETFKLNSLRSIQREALEKLVSGEDAFVIQPTGSGKSLIFQAAPIVFDESNRLLSFNPWLSLFR